MDVVQLEVLCKQFYESTDPVLQSEAQKAMIAFTSCPDALRFCRLLLDRADSSYSQALAAQTLTKLIPEISVHECIEIRSYVLFYLMNRPNLENFVVQLLASLLAKITRHNWSDTCMGESSFQRILEDVKPFLDNSTPLRIVGIQILSELVTEMNVLNEIEEETKQGRSVKIVLSYRDTQLHETFVLSCSLLMRLRETSLVNLDESQRSLVLHILLLARQCLSFVFTATTSEASADDLEVTVDMPSSWRVSILDQNCLKLFFDLYQELHMDLANHALFCLCQMTSIRRYFFTMEERPKFLKQLVEGIIKILSNLHGLDNPENHQQFCKLLVRLVVNYQMGLLVGVTSYPEFIELVANFTIQSFHMWKFAPNSVYFLLSLWQNMVKIAPHVKDPESHLMARYAPEVFKAYIESRLEAVPVIEASNLEDPLDDICLIEQHLEKLAIIGQSDYTKVCNFIKKTFVQKARDYESLVQTPNANPIDKKIHELQLTWLVYINGNKITARQRFSSRKEHIDMDTELITQVLQLMHLLESLLPRTGCEKLELALLSFLDHVYKMHCSEEMLKGKVFKRFYEIVGFADEQVLLGFIFSKIISNLNYWFYSEAITVNTIMLLVEMAKRPQQLAKVQMVQFLLANHTKENLAFLGTNYSLEEMRRRTMFYYSLGCILLVDLRDEDERFYSFVMPFTRTFESLSTGLLETRGYATDEPKKTVIGLARDLRGVAFTLEKRYQYAMFFNWIYYSDYLSIFIRSVELWTQDPNLTSPVLKLFAELVCWNGERQGQTKASHMGILMFREASKLICLYGHSMLRQEVPGRAQLYPMRLKGFAICFVILNNALNSKYLNCGILNLYGDDALKNVLDVTAKLMLSTAKREFLKYPKLSSAFYNVIYSLSQFYMPCLAGLEPNAFGHILGSVSKGLKSINSTIHESCCHILENLMSFILKQIQLKQATFPNEKLRMHLQEDVKFLEIVDINTDTFRHMLTILLHNILYKNSSNHTLLARSLLGLILLYESHFQSVKAIIISSQTPPNQENIASAFDDLMVGVERTFSDDNRMIFSNNLKKFCSLVAQYHGLIVPAALKF